MGRTIRFKGAPMRLVGRRLREGARAPEFTAVSRDMKQTRLSDFGGKVKVITSFPSLDTPVCDAQLKEFNARAAGLSGEAVVLGVSMDLPFAQKRFCDMNGIAAVTVLSDYARRSFGVNYGLLIRELGLLARAVIIADANDVVRSVQIVEELTSPPDYEAAFAALRVALAGPALPGEGGFHSRCTPCEGGVPPLPRGEVERLLPEAPGWDAVDGKKLVREFEFPDFTEGKCFLDLVAVVAEEQGHHPVMTLGYRRLRVTFTTHAAGGLTRNDFIMARSVSELWEGVQ